MVLKNNNMIGDNQWRQNFITPDHIFTDKLHIRTWQDLLLGPLLTLFKYVGNFFSIAIGIYFTATIVWKITKWIYHAKILYEVHGWISILLAPCAQIFMMREYHQSRRERHGQPHVDRRRQRRRPRARSRSPSSSGSPAPPLPARPLLAAAVNAWLPPQKALPSPSAPIPLHDFPENANSRQQPKEPDTFPYPDLPTSPTPSTPSTRKDCLNLQPFSYGEVSGTI